MKTVSEHQHKGMAGAKLRSNHRGRTASINPEEVQRLRKALSPTESPSDLVSLGAVSIELSSLVILMSRYDCG
jgi:hypothetical protein